MKSRLLAFAFAAGYFATSVAGPPLSASLNRHRVAACMSRQMAVSRTLSYYAAQALCEDQLKAQERLRTPEGLKAQNDKSITSNPLASNSAR